MANTFELIASSTVGAGGAASIAFSSIPSTYTDLCIKLSARSTRSGYESDGLTITLNSTGVSAGRGLYGSGSGAASDTDTIVGVFSAAATTANTFGNAEIYIPNYTPSNNKSISSDAVGENNGTTAYMRLSAVLVPLTSAITSITLASATSSNFVQYSTAYLYGVKNA